MGKSKAREFTVSQQTVIDWINEHEDQVQFLYEMGLYDEATKAAIISNDEKVLLKVKKDPEFAERQASGEEGRSEAVTEAGGDIAAEGNDE